MKKISAVLITIAMLFTLNGCSKNSDNSSENSSDVSVIENTTNSDSTISESNSSNNEPVKIPENFTLIIGGTFEMGSPETEAWRSADETQHTVTVSDFYMSVYELSQSEYQEITGENPSNFSGDELPVENISWLDAVNYCNARSTAEGLTPAYTISENNVTWDRSADGYRLPTEAEWEYACRAATATPFNTENSISAEEANYYGHYPYEIEDNYFS